MDRQLHRLGLAFAAAFFLIALMSGYWAFVRRAELLERADNPRRVLAERRSRRGTIYDRNGAALAESVGAPGDFERRYPHPDLAPVIGYVSAFYGSAGIEAAADPVLHGDAGRDATNLWWDDLLGAQPPGRAVRLSIDLRLQTADDDALGDRAGAVVLLDAATGEILALASHPTYDPNSLDQQWQALVNDPHAPLLNRAAFALYQPGGALQPMILAAALRAGLVNMNTPYPAAVEVNVGDLKLGCCVQPGSDQITLAEAFNDGCPAPFANLGGQLGPRALDQLFSDFRLFEAPDISIPTTASSHPNLNAEASAIAAIGQGSLTITPLHLALITAAIAHHGEMPAPQLLIALQNPRGLWESVAPTSHPIAALTPEAADQVKALMADGHKAVALTGAEGKTLAWFSGFAPFDDSRYVVTVLLEDGDVEGAAQIGRELLAKAVSLTP